MKKLFIACLFGLVFLSNTAFAAIIDQEWLQGKLQELPVDKKVEYSVYLKILNNNTEPAIIINSKILPSASLIKIPIIIEAYQQQQLGKLNLKESILIDKNIAVEGGSIYEMPVGQVLTVEQLLELMIVQSDNTATNILIDKLGMDNINRNIRWQLGMFDTSLQRKMMDFEAVKQGRQNYTSVTDMGIMLEKLYLKQIINCQASQAIINTLLRQEDNTCIPAQIPQPIKIAHKTGQLDGQYYDAAIVYAPRNHYILIIMADNVTNEPQALYDISEISRVIYDQLGRQPY